MKPSLDLLFKQRFPSRWQLPNKASKTCTNGFTWSLSVHLDSYHTDVRTSDAHSDIVPAFVLCQASFLDGVDAHDGDSISRDNLVTQIPRKEKQRKGKGWDKLEESLDFPEWQSVKTTSSGELGHQSPVMTSITSRKEFQPHCNGLDCTTGRVHNLAW